MQMGTQHERYNYSQIFGSSNWIQAAIEFPLTYTPGTTFSYNTCQTHLLSAILTKSSAMSTKALADSFLLNPMTIDVDRWDQDPDGYYFGGNSMYFTPREMAVLGYLFMHDGFINGQQVVPKHWVESCLENSSGLENNDWGNLHDLNYGYLWWLGEIKGYKTFQAMGYGGQLVVCFPKLSMIVVSTSRTNVSWSASDQHIAAIIDIIAEQVIPSLK
jgi:CubicO group peptidase (beta-lactamase class C family)